MLLRYQSRKCLILIDILVGIRHHFKLIWITVETFFDYDCLGTSEKRNWRSLYSGYSSTLPVGKTDKLGTLVSVGHSFGNHDSNELSQIRYSLIRHSSCIEKYRIARLTSVCITSPILYFLEQLIAKPRKIRSQIIRPSWLIHVGIVERACRCYLRSIRVHRG